MRRSSLIKCKFFPVIIRFYRFILCIILNIRTISIFGSIFTKSPIVKFWRFVLLKVNDIIDISKHSSFSFILLTVKEMPSIAMESFSTMYLKRSPVALKEKIHPLLFFSILRTIPIPWTWPVTLCPPFSSPILAENSIFIEVPIFNFDNRLK